MRPLFLIGALVVTGVLAAPAPGIVLARTPGSVELHLYDGAGTARIRYRGNLLGRMARGRIVATKQVTLGGCESRRSLSATLKECRGTGLTFRTPSWTSWRVRLSGWNIDASGFVRGCLTLNGVDTGYPGTFQIGSDGARRRWPRVATTHKLGQGC